MKEYRGSAPAAASSKKRVVEEKWVANFSRSRAAWMSPVRE